MRISLLSAALLATTFANAATPVNGWYASAFGGYTYMPENITATRHNLLIDDSAYNNSFNAGGRVGYQTYPLRYELEFTYIQANLHRFAIDTIRQTGLKGQTSADVIMANIYYDFPDMVPAVSPFVGIGLGYAHLQANFKNSGPFTHTIFSASGNEFAYQATAGFTYNCSENYAVNLAYRYLETARVAHFGKVFEAHIASVGVIYRFDQASYK